MAFLLRELLEQFGLECFPKVSGSKGLQVYIPLNTSVTYDVIRAFAKAIADLLAEQHPRLIVAEMAKAVRSKKVFIDWSQNSDFKTTVAVYSLRAKKLQPFASVPVRWDELHKAIRKKDTAALYFGIDETLARVEELGDLFKLVLSLKQKLPASILKRLLSDDRASFLDSGKNARS